MKTKIAMLFLGLGLVFTLACSKYPPDTERLLEDMAVITQYDVNADFNQYKTFSMPTSIIKITNSDTTNISNSKAQAALNQVSKDMQSRGFVLAVSPQKPDLGVGVVYYENTIVTSYYYGDYWGYPYYGYGYYYPYYPTYYTSYTAGFANIELLDLKNETNNTIYLRWNAGIRGLLTGDHTIADITGAIDQAFTQTPQLVTSAK